MAGEFKIKTGLILGAAPTQPVVSIKDTSISITQDASSLLATGKAIYDFVEGQNLWTESDNIITPKNSTHDVELSSIEIEVDSGSIVLVNMDVSAAIIDTEESYSMQIDGADVLKVYGNSDGSGSVDETAVVVEGDYLSMGDPKTNGSWRFMVDSSGNMSVQKRVSGSWVEKGNFS